MATRYNISYLQLIPVVFFNKKRFQTSSFLKRSGVFQEWYLKNSYKMILETVSSKTTTYFQDAVCIFEKVY